MLTRRVGRRQALALTLSACAATAGALGCTHNAAFGGSQLNFYSEAQEIAMGRQADSQVTQTIGIYDDPALQSYVQQLGAKLAAKSERPNLPWQFRVVNDASVNAFAIPGGFIYVTRGLIASVENEAQLAGVIGHEIGHVTARHQLTTMSQQQVTSLGLGIAAALSPTINKFGGLINSGMQLLYLKYSRDDENQADELGVRYMNRDGYDPQQMASVMTMLDHVSQAEGGSKTPQWLETHPDPGNRRAHIEQLTSHIAADSMGHTVEQNSYLNRLAGLIYGEDPRDGFFQGSKFLHPGLKFQMDFPQGWQTQNTPQAVGAISPQQDAIVEATLAQGANSPAAAAQQFSSQQGVQAGPTTRVSLQGGLSGITVPFTAQDQNAGTIQGTALFLSQSNTVFMLLGYAPQQAWGARQGEVERSMQSFQPLTDPAALAAQPMRLQLVHASGGTTLQQMAQQRPAPVGVDKLALINQVEPTTALPASLPVKWVTGQAVAVSSRNRQ